MSASSATVMWQAATQTLMSIRYLPATIYLIQETVNTIVTNSWNTPGAILGNMPELIWNVFQYWTVWLAVGLMIPFDRWIVQDFYKTALADKTPGGADHDLIQRRSTIMFLVSGLIAFSYSTWVLILDLFNGPLTSRSDRAKAQLWTAVIGFLTSVSYFFTVNTYDHI